MKIKQFLNKKQDRRLIQARIDKGIYDKLRQKLRQNDVNIRNFIEASAKAYLAE